MENKNIDYKKRLAKAFDAMLKIIEINKPKVTDKLKRMIKAQQKNLEGVENRTKGNGN